MRKMKLYVKVLLFTLFVIPLAFILAACGEDSQSGNGSNENNANNGANIVNASSVAVSAAASSDNTPPDQASSPAIASATATTDSTATATASADNASASAPASAGLQNFTGITFNNLTCDYDGNAHEIVINGVVPAGTNVDYTNNSATNSGTYNASVTLTLDGYNPLTLYATLKINKANYDISGADWDYGLPFIYDGTLKEIFVVGLPAGVTVQSYQNNSNTDVGTYSASVTLNYDSQNYNAVAIPNCTWRILPDLSSMAENITNRIMRVPDPWEFLPESFDIENKAYTGSTELNLTSFTNVNTLPQVGLGKQMKVVYSTLLKADEALGYVRTVYGSINIIVDLYQTFINTNPDDYSCYEYDTGTFVFKIMIDDHDYKMLVSISSVAIELTYDVDTEKCYGRIQLSDSNVIKYEADDDLTIAVDLVGLALYKLQFIRNDDVVSGYLYEYYGTADHNIKTSALIRVDEEYTTIVSNKRETDDLVIEGYMEVYKNSTGNLVGAEVKETVNLADYDTCWFNLWDVTNINTIKVLDEENGLNADTIFINGSDTAIKTKLVGGFSLKATSRRFDIEMKDFYFYVYNEGEQKYEEVQISIPMLFVQRGYVDFFSSDFDEKNSSTGASNPTTIAMDNDYKTYMFAEYDVLIDAYLAIKEQVTYQSIVDYIGTRDEYFDA